MSSVASLLDDEHAQRVRDVWAELAGEFAVHDLHAASYPHLSYLVADGGDPEMLALKLRSAAAKVRSFEIATKGLGIFTGDRPVLYIPVVRDAALTQMQQMLWSDFYAAGASPDDSSGYYHPDSWTPHITLASGDLSYSQLPAIVGHFCRRNFDWRIKIDNLALIHKTEARQVVALYQELPS